MRTTKYFYILFTISTLLFAVENRPADKNENAMKIIRLDDVMNTVWSGVKQEASGEELLISYEFLPEGKAFMLWVWLPNVDVKEPNGAIMLGSYAVNLEYKIVENGVILSKHGEETRLEFKNGNLVMDEPQRPPFVLTKVASTSLDKSKRSATDKHIPSILNLRNDKE